MLDANLAGERPYAVAEKACRVEHPFIFATGYTVDTIAASWAGRPVLQKPFTTAVLGSAITAALAGSKI